MRTSVQRQLLVLGLLWGLWLPGAGVAGPPPAIPSDTLLARIKNPSTADSIRIRYLTMLCRHLISNDLPAARRYGEESVALIRRTGFRRMQAAALNNLAAVYSYMGDYPAAQRTFEELLAVGRRDALPKYVGNAYTGLGVVAHELGNHSLALKRYAQAHTAFAACRPPDAAGEMRVLNNISNVYGELKQPAKAALALRQALALANAPGVQPHTTVIVLAGLAGVQQEAHHLDSARANYERGLRLAQSLSQPDTDGEALALGGLADVALELRQPAVALPYACRAVQLAHQAGKTRTEEDALRALAEALNALHLPGAYDTLKSYLAIHDTLLAQDRADAVVIAQGRFNDVEQRAHIAGLAAAAKVREADLNRRTTLLWAALVGAALLVALAVVLINRNRLKQRANALLNDQKNALAVAAAKLQTLNATKDRLSAIVAHDLRNPLAALTGIQTLIQRYVRRGEPERLVELGDHLEQTAQGLYGVLDNVLGWAISQSGELEARPEALDVTALVREAVAIGQLTATSHDIDLRMEVGADLILTADRQMVRTLLRNLLGNALKFTPAGGTVILSAEGSATADRPTLRFCIRDTGPGFSAAAAAAWAAAEVGPRSPDASGRSGQGLGLVVCRAFARQLGGELAWRNRPEGGAEVTLALPVGVDSGVMA